MDWIQGDKFITLADYTYSPKVKVNDDYDKLPNTLNVTSLKDGDIIYTHVMYVNSLFAALLGTNKKVIVISHNGDNHMVDISNMPKNVIKWYSQNVAVKNKRLESIPIGLENNRWNGMLRKKEKMEFALKAPKMMRNLVYMCHTTKTNPVGRDKLYDMFADKSWITAERNSPFDWYLDNIYNHKFMICPEGNGIDTHRLWECLYMNTIPIEKRNINNQFYTDLPISFVDSWEEVTFDFLATELQRIHQGIWNMEKFTFEYWKNKIKNTL